jgi:hypothetical protein
MAKRSTTTREKLSPRGDTRYAKRSRTGQFTEMDDAGRAQAADRRRKAKKTVKSGHGDQGDRKRR